MSGSLKVKAMKENGSNVGVHLFSTYAEMDLNTSFLAAWSAIAPKKAWQGRKRSRGWGGGGRQGTSMKRKQKTELCSTGKLTLRCVVVIGLFFCCVFQSGQQMRNSLLTQLKTMWEV
jgi:hypothetical protein